VIHGTDSWYPAILQRRAASDRARYWRTPVLPGAELLTARFHAQRFAPHWHDTYNIPIILAGAQRYRYRGAAHIAGGGAIAAINPGEVHTGERAAADGWAYRAFYPPVAWIAGLAAGIADRDASPPAPVFPFQVVIDPELAARLARAHRALEIDDDRLSAESELHAAFAVLLVRHARPAPVIAARAADSARVAAMKNLLAADRADAALGSSPVTLADLARAVELSPFHALRSFVRAVGMPPHAWRNQLRLTRAVAMLRRGLAVGTVAARCGYADQSHFTRQFRRAYGDAPGRWQRG
jgi:AraC-like DNA-binding protein